MGGGAPWEVSTGLSNEWVTGGSGGIEHMRVLKQIVRETGLEAPFYTSTGCGVTRRCWRARYCPLYEVVYALFTGSVAYCYESGKIYDCTVRRVLNTNAQRPQCGPSPATRCYFNRRTTNRE